MAKKRTRKSTESPVDLRNRMIDSMFGSMRTVACEVTGRDDVTIGAEGEELIIGLPLPSLCLRYLFQMDVLPLGRVTQLTGAEGSCKSALLFEMMRWHMLYGGGAAIAEAEDKDSTPLRNSIFWRDSAFMNRCLSAPVNSAEEWQRFLTKEVCEARRFMDQPGGIGRTMPMAFGIDSLTAKDVEKVIEKTYAEGSASPGYAILAKSISVYMRSFTGLLRGFPFSVIATNHLKEGTDERGLPKNNVPGGKSVPFMATFIIEAKRVADIDKAEYGGLRVKLLMRKNSLGPSRKFMQAELLWWREKDPVTGRFIQRHQWDWNGASIELLLSFANQSGKKGLYNEIQKIVDLHTATPKGQVWSKVLGIPSTQTVHWRVAGQMLEQRPELLVQLYPLLGINEFPYFQPGMDYMAAIDAEKQKLQASAEAYTDLSSLPVLPPTDISDAAAVEEAFGDSTEPEFEEQEIEEQGVEA